MQFIQRLQVPDTIRQPGDYSQPQLHHLHRSIIISLFPPFLRPAQVLLLPLQLSDPLLQPPNLLLILLLLVLAHL